MTVLQILSTFTAMYAFLVFAQICAVPLKVYNVRISMKLAQFVIVFYTLQGNIFNLIANSGKIYCTQLLPASAVASGKYVKSSIVLQDHNFISET